MTAVFFIFYFINNIVYLFGKINLAININIILSFRYNNSIYVDIETV